MGTKKSKNPQKEVVRVAFRFHGPELAQIRDVRDMLSLNSETDAARYLMQRGLEAITATLTSRRTQEKMAQMVGGMDPEAIIKKLIDSGYEPQKP